MRTLDASALPAGSVVTKIARDRESMERAFATAREIVDAVRRDGDAALLALTERFDRVKPRRLVLSRDELRSALDRIPAELREALAFASRQIVAFHRPQVPVGYEVAIGPGGSVAGQQPRALDRVGVYVPAGPRGYPSTVLMGGIPARLAGVREVLVATPPSRATGLPPDVVLAAAALADIDRVVVAGGAQAVAAMAYGTESVPRVDKIVGPGNVYVSAAKLLVQDRVATDGIAGPSEVAVIADGSLPPDLLAAELLAQAEHDPDAVAVALVAGNGVDQILEAVARRSESVPRGPEALAALRRNGWLVRVRSVAQAVEIADGLAPEHLVLAVRDARPLLYAVRNAGCVFLGRWTTAALGDYTAGTNHVLPTAGSARWRGGLGVRDFVRFVTYVEVAPSDLAALSGPAARIARAEGFEAHVASLEARIALPEEVPR